MTAKEHYDRHLGNCYAWMLGDFTGKMEEQKDFFIKHGILTSLNQVAFDLGAGNGIQSVALAKLGFKVKAVDFNKQLIGELNINKGNLFIEIFESEICSFLNETKEKAELIICMGDTITHFNNPEEIRLLINKTASKLLTGGKVVCSFRDLTDERKGSERFFLLRKDESRTMSCFLEYFPQHVMVHDIVVEKINDQWVQKVSAYPKLRLNQSVFLRILQDYNITILHKEVIGGMFYLIGQKN